MCITVSTLVFFFFQAEDGIRDCLLSRGLGDVYKRQNWTTGVSNPLELEIQATVRHHVGAGNRTLVLYKSTEYSQPLSHP